MTELVNRGGTRLKAEEGALSGFVFFAGVVADNFLGEFAGFGGFLTPDQVKRETVGVLDGEFVTAARCIIQLPYFSAELLLRLLEILLGLRLETSTTELGLIRLLCNVDVLVRSVSSEVNARIIFFDNVHAEIEKEFPGLSKVGVTVCLAS